MKFSKLVNSNPSSPRGSLNEDKLKETAEIRNIVKMIEKSLGVEEFYLPKSIKTKLEAYAGDENYLTKSFCGSDPSKPIFFLIVLFTEWDDSGTVSFEFLTPKSLIGKFETHAPLDYKDGIEKCISNVKSHIDDIAFYFNVNVDY